MTQNETETICYVEVPKRTQKAKTTALIPRGKLITKSEGLWPWQSAKFTRKEQYRIYIGSPHWKLRQRQAVVRAGRACEHCDRKNRLTVHHLHYRTLFNEGAEDLMCLCWTCHKQAQGKGEDRQAIIAFLEAVRPSPPKTEKRIVGGWIYEGLVRLIELAEVEGFHCRYLN